MNSGGPSVLRAAGWWRAAAAVAATYVYFLIFAEFALIELALARGVAAAQLRLVMGTLGAAGVVGAGLGAWLHDPARPGARLPIAFLACAAGAGAALLADSLVAWMAVAGVVGLALGAQTVLLVAALRAAAGPGVLGLCVGLGTGAAYAVCNLPVVFAASSSAQAGLGIAAALVGAGLSAGMVGGRERGVAPVPAVGRGDAARWVVALFALVWMDSAVFYIIQHTSELRTATWAGEGKLWANAAVHLGAALLAGIALDRGWRRLPALAGMGLLVAASLMLGAGRRGAFEPQWLYTAGVSLYSVVLVHFPAASARAGLGALVFGFAGWVGSALGIGMAQDLHQVPAWFAVAAAAVLGGALLGRRRQRPAAVAGTLLVLVAAPNAMRGSDDEVVRGREVYIREGCIHCHSQYVRPRVAAEVTAWGPGARLESLLAEAPPLPGNRRQGPDLANVGNRRSLEWNRLHLMAPREISPGSRMPSYAHLFRGHDSDGEALVRYLASLGAESLPERLAVVQAWRPAPAVAVNPVRAARLAAQLCAPCHGPLGRGDGPVAARLSIKPPDWPANGWRWVRADSPDLEADLARIIKFGLPGSPMAGHEYLPDADAVGLARQVRMWQKPGTATP